MAQSSSALEQQPRKTDLTRSVSISRSDYDPAESYSNVDDDLHEERTSPSENRAQTRSRGLQRQQSLTGAAGRLRDREKPLQPKPDVSRLAAQLYTISHLILFSILGTLARLGLQALTAYPGTPVIFHSLWPNFAGCLVMGFLSKDRTLFRTGQPPRGPTTDEGSNATTTTTTTATAAAVPTKQSQPQPETETLPAAPKHSIPLYIGLTTGFCGSLTSFSALMRDLFLALSNDLTPTPATATDPGQAGRGGGHAFLALLAVALVTVSLSLSALFLGAHLAHALAPVPALCTPVLPRALRTLLDRAAVFLAWGCWLAAVLLSVLPPAGHRRWRGDATFALVFAPLGCLLRFFASARLNRRVPAFPLGTFLVNVAGTGVMAMAWDLAHSGPGGQGGVVGCQVLVGVQDGFCGCLTTVSTWVGELAALRKRHAYVYGGASILGGFAVVVAVMGGLRWSGGYEPGACAPV